MATVEGGGEEEGEDDTECLEMIDIPINKVGSKFQVGVVSVLGVTCLMPLPPPNLQRLRHFHYFLWVLAHGYSPGEGVVAGEDQRGSLSLHHFPWAKVVHQLAPSSSAPGKGCIEFRKVLANMPIALWMILFKLNSCSGVVSHVIQGHVIM